MLVLVGVLVVLFVVALVLSEGRWGQRRRERVRVVPYMGFVAGGEHVPSDCSGGGFWGGGDFGGGGGGDGGGC